MQRDHTSDAIIERAVELWCRALQRPKFDNGDKSETGFFGAALHNSNANHDLAKIDDFTASVERFREILVAKLKFGRDNEGQPTGKQLSYGPETVRFDRDLNTDYGPDQALGDAATEAGLPHSVFSWKSTVSFYSPTHVRSSFGYAAPDMNHYPLSGGRWLICELTGSQMPVIIQAVEDGRLPELTVEEPGSGD